MRIFLVLLLFVGLSLGSCTFHVDPNRETDTSEEWQNKLYADTAFTSASCHITWGALVDNNQTTGEFRLRDYTDGVTVGSSAVITSSSSDDRIPISGRGVSLIPVTGKKFIIQYRAAPGSDGYQGIKEAYINICC